MTARRLRSSRQPQPPQNNIPTPRRDPRGGGFFTLPEEPVTSLSEELEAGYTPELGHSRCAFGRALDAFPDDAAKMLEMAKPGPGVTRRQIVLSNILAKHDYQCRETSMRRHMEKCCVCYR